MGLNTRIPIIIPIEGRGFVNQGSGFVYVGPLLGFHVSLWVPNNLNPKKASKAAS